MIIYTIRIKGKMDATGSVLQNLSLSPSLSLPLSKIWSTVVVAAAQLRLYLRNHHIIRIIVVVIGEFKF
jgi:hypothetical protein